MSSTASLDPLLKCADAALKTLSGATRARRPNPAAGHREAELDAAERRLIIGLMRVNHVGEVCAQALYESQALMARDPAVRAQLLAAAREEQDHLAWCEDRLQELGGRTSWLNPVWFAGAFALGLVAGRRGDGQNLGFLEETERQVEAHLADHLSRLPEADQRSRAIVAQMKLDEAAHAEHAAQMGATPLPALAKQVMRLGARLMTRTAHHV